MQYSIPNEATPFTASAIIDQHPNGTVICAPAGAAPPQHQITFNVVGNHPSFTVLFTFS